MTSRIGWSRATTERQRKRKQEQEQEREEKQEQKRKEEQRRREEERQREKAPKAGPGRWIRVGVTVLALAAMVVFGVVLARLTLQPSPASELLTHTNLRPGDSIRAYLGQPAFRDTVKQLGGNVLLGVPFGLLLPVVSPRTRGFVRIALLTVATMLLVELVQGALITGRAFDIDDVLLNTAGALLGYALVGRRLSRAVYPRRRRRWWSRSRT
ncbi:VanZ family protein [Streptomyces sp. NPDC017254]|uniref:VanZ family protein n=1 Tax=unclassified Streptomyces TaxID=2593676 RepID=UPI0037B4200D